MVKSSTKLEPSIAADDLTRTSPLEDALLVAALAATLVEYRDQVSQERQRAGSRDVSSRWRVISRLEQLRGQV